MQNPNPTSPENIPDPATGIPQNPKPQVGVILIDHGSRRADAHLEMLQLGQQIQAQCPAWDVAIAHMEIAEPSLETCAKDCIARGCTELRILPWFLSGGRHLREDIPQLVDALRQLYPQIRISMRPHLGAHPGLIQIAQDLAE